jgi:GNAT superfamily N-acetyltransferase
MTIIYRTSKSIFDCYRAHALTTGIDDYYPEFNNWFWNKVVPSVVTGESSIILAEQHDQIVGVSIVKAGSDPKIRCLRVREEYAGRGVGVHLIDKSLRLLDCDKPVVTVPEEKINDLSRILVNRFSFNLLKVDRGLYRPGKLEYQFNGEADQRLVTPY